MTAAPPGATAAGAGRRDHSAAREPLLEVKGLQVHFPIKRGVFFDRTVGHVRAVDGVDLTVRRGSTYGLDRELRCRHPLQPAPAPAAAFGSETP